MNDLPLALGQILDGAAERVPDKPAVVFNTYPAEIENFYLRHPKILDVSIVGVPDPVLGEVVMASVIPKAGAALTPLRQKAWAVERYGFSGPA